MEILAVELAQIKEVLILTYTRFLDKRGYFSETYNKQDFKRLKIARHLTDIIQANESFSKKNTVRGLHFQWNPFMGKLVRTIYGHMIDLIVDIRPNSTTFGRGIMIDMSGGQDRKVDQLIWIPPGFAHGNFFLEETLIQYFCDGTYNSSCEAGIYPFSPDIDWSLADPKLYSQFTDLKTKCLMSPKDRKGITLNEWKNNKNSSLFSIK